MADNDELLMKLEREFQKEIETQKKFYESKIELLQSEFENYKHQTRLELENKISWAKDEVKAFYDAKNLDDANKIKEYYEKEILSQKEWYEKEIERRVKETENWHIKNLEEQILSFKKGYEEMLQAKDDKIKALTENLKSQEETFSTFIEEQKTIYNEQLKPFKKVIKLKNKVDNILKKDFCFPKEKIINEESEAIVENEQGKRPKVSVILPVYNVGKYLRQSLDSLINQTLKDIEIICVDDGSIDDCYDILEEYKQKDNRINVIHKSNKGTGAARNDGLKLAKGECIGFVDPDDWVKPNMYERLYKEIKDKNLDIIMCMPDGYDEKNAVNAPFPYFIDDNFKNIIDDRVFNWKDLSPFKYPMCVWNKLYTKKLFDDNQIDFAEGLDFEDHKVIFGTLLSAERIYFIREKLYVYRFNREGSVLTDNNNRLIDHIKIFDIVEDLMKKTNTFEVLRSDFLTYKIHNLLYYYGMIKDEFKKEYYGQMQKSLKDTNLTNDEYSMLCEKYPELKNINLF